MVETTIPPIRRDFYVYVIFRAETGEPCYVGKGQRDRWKSHSRRSHNRRLRRIYAKAGGKLPITKVREGLTDDEACAVETAFIRAIGREDIGAGPLVNFTDGGEGMAGYVPTPEHRSKVRVALSGKKRPPEIGEAVRRAAAWERPEWREKQRTGHIGHKISDASRLSMCVSHLRRHGRSLEDVGAPGFQLTAFQRKLLNKPQLPKPRPPLPKPRRKTPGERSDAQRRRNAGNQYGLGNKRTTEGQARVTQSIIETNKRRNKSGKPTVHKGPQPWLDEGMSRTSWYRKRAAELPTQTELEFLNKAA